MQRMSRPKRVKVDRAVWKPLQLYTHQQEAVDAYKRGLLRFYLAWHRRAGKDTFGMDFARERMQERIGTYIHMFPFHAQAKRGIWKGIDARTGERFIDRAFPKVMRKSEPNDTEMSLQLTCGSTWQMLGSDNYDRSVVGGNPCGVVLSEWALCDPAAWDFIRPILVENKGWAMFITTFRGRNHAWRMYETVKELEDWYTSLRTIKDTYRLDGSPIVSDADVQKEIRAGMNTSLVEQEFYCNPDAATTGAIFTRQHARLNLMSAQAFAANNRILRIAWGMHTEGIAAVAFQDRHVIGTHVFLESNLTDCVQTVTRRHPHMQLVHHAVRPDPLLFSQLDGEGVVTAPVSVDEHIRQGNVAAFLNVCDATATAREALTDFAMSFAPYRQVNDEMFTHPALHEALAVVQSAQLLTQNRPRKPMDYSRYDRGVI